MLPGSIHLHGQRTKGHASIIDQTPSPTYMKAATYVSTHAFDCVLRHEVQYVVIGIQACCKPAPDDAPQKSGFQILIQNFNLHRSFLAEGRKQECICTTAFPDTP